MRAIRVTQIARQMKFKAVCFEIAPKKDLQRQPADYLRLTLVLMWSSAMRETFNFCFSKYFMLALTKF